MVAVFDSKSAADELNGCLIERNVLTMCYVLQTNDVQEMVICTLHVASDTNTVGQHIMAVMPF